MKPLCAAVLAALALPGAAQAGASIVARDVPLHGGARSPAVSSGRFDLVGLHWRGNGSVRFRTRLVAGRWSAWQRAAELMDLVKLSSGALHRYPHEFSGGQRQRICIARALAVEPEVLIADEAVSALDVSVQAQILALLDDIQQRLQLTLVFITHDLRVAAQICSSVVVLQFGRVIEHGPLREVFENPKQEYTRALLQAAPGRGFDFARRM